jgi:hypothetical protein
MSRNALRSIAALMVAAAISLPGSVLAAPAPAPTEKADPVAPAPEKDPKAPPSLAEVKVTKEEAIAIVKGIFTIPADMNEPNGGISQSKTGAVWRLDWQSPSKSALRMSINVQVDAVTGAIVGYYKNVADQGTIADVGYSRTEAYKVAAGWLEKLAADRKDSLRYTDDPLAYGYYGGSTTYNFHWSRLEQGYPISGQGIDIAVDARNGELTSFNANWTTDPDVTFKLPEKILDKAAAEEAYRNSMLFGLSYQRFQLPGTDKGDWRLVYRPTGGNWPNVSQDGKLVDGSGAAIDFSRYTDTKMVPKGEKPYTKPEKPVTREAALAMAQAISGRVENPSSVDCSEYGEESKSLQCNFNWYTEGEQSNSGVSIDMKTGLLSNFSNWKPWEPAKEQVQPKVSQEKAREIALAFMQKYRPDMAGSALVGPMSNYPGMDLRYMRSWNINFTWLVNGVQVSGPNANVEVDFMTGEIIYAYANSLEINPKEPMPEATGLLRQTDVSDSFLKYRGLELAWIQQWPAQAGPYGKYAPMEKGEPVKPTTVLAWVPRQNYNMEAIDAKTGVPYDWNGRDLIEAAKRPSDIDGHFAQREIELLWARGVFELKDGKFNPDQNATAADLARWLVLARGLQPYPMYDYAGNFGGRGAAAETIQKSAAAPYFGAALQAGILVPEDFDEVAPDAPVSREIFALWLVRALGYGEIAKMPNQIAMPFADKPEIGARYANAAAILNGLGIAKGDETAQFFPNRMVTRGEAAKMLFAVAAKGRMYPY